MNRSLLERTNLEVSTFSSCYRHNHGRYQTKLIYTLCGSKLMFIGHVMRLEKLRQLIGKQITLVFNHKFCIYINTEQLQSLNKKYLRLVG